MGDTRRVPYRLPELLLSDEVIVVEGEKDVDVLVTQADRAATCNPGGAGKWRAQYAQYLKEQTRLRHSRSGRNRAQAR